MSRRTAVRSPAASRLSRNADTRITRSAMRRSRPCARSGTARHTDRSVTLSCPTNRPSPARAAACAGAFERMSPPSTTASAAGDPARTLRTAVVIPTLNEEASIGGVIRALPRDWVSRIIVADGGSTDATTARAREAGARVIAAGRGYGRARPAGAQAAGDAEVVVFVGGGGADAPADRAALGGPLRSRKFALL